MRYWSCIVTLCLICAVILSACAVRMPIQTMPTFTQSAPSPVPTLVLSSTPIPATVTAISSSPTAAAPTAIVSTPVLAPTQPAATQVPPSPTSAELAVKVYLIAVGDNGTSGKLIGCGDSVVAVEKRIAHSPAVLKGALDALFALKDQYYGQSGLYNALYQSDLHLERAVLQNGKATVHLSGALKMGGECDIPRVEAQIKETALQFSTVKELEVFINGKSLKEALSLK